MVGDGLRLRWRAGRDFDAIQFVSVEVHEAHGHLVAAGLDDGEVMNVVVRPRLRQAGVGFAELVERAAEARFEYAGSGPMTGADQIVMFPWGQNLSQDGRLSDADLCHVNIKDTSSNANNPSSNPDPFERTSPVGFFDGALKTRDQGGWTDGPDTYQTCDDTGPFGHRDLTHNVMELVGDGPSSYQDWVDGAVDPEMAPNCIGIMVRNTSWYWEEIHHCLVTNRHERCIQPGSLPTGMEYNRDVMRFDDVGFRCAFQ